MEIGEEYLGQCGINVFVLFLFFSNCNLKQFLGIYLTLPQSLHNVRDEHARRHRWTTGKIWWYPVSLSILESTHKFGLIKVHSGSVRPLQTVRSVKSLLVPIDLVSSDYGGFMFSFKKCLNKLNAHHAWKEVRKSGITVLWIERIWLCQVRSLSVI